MRKLTAVRRKGQGLVEYGLVLVLIAVLVAVALLLVGNQVLDMYLAFTSTLGRLIH